MKKLCFVILIADLFSSVCYAAGPINVTLIVPAGEGHIFWEQIVEFGEAVANDLGIELSVKYTGGNQNAISNT